MNPNVKMRGSGVEWIGEIPEHWEVRKFSQVISIQEGQVDPSIEPYKSMILIAPNHIESKTGILLYTETAEEQGADSGKYLCREGDVVYSKISPYLAKVVISPCDSLCSGDMYPMRCDQNILENEFLYWLLLSDSYTRWAVLESMRVVIPRLNRETMSGYRIPVPPYETQKQIADFLDKETTRIDTLISKKQTQIELLQEKRQSIITQSVTKGLNPNGKMKDSGVEWIGEIPEHWESIKLKYISTKVNSGKTPRGGSESYQDTGVMLIRSQNVYFDGLRLNDVVFIDKDTDQEMSNSRVLPRDVLLNITGASIGRSYYVPQGFPSSNVNQHVCIIRPNHRKVITEYLWLCMASSVIQKIIFSNEKGTSREGITFEQIKNFDIPLPRTIEEQSQIAERILSEIDRNDRTISKIQSSIDLLTEYRSSLITHAVSGQIDITQYEVSK